MSTPAITLPFIDALKNFQNIEIAALNKALAAEDRNAIINAVNDIISFHKSTTARVRFHNQQPILHTKDARGNIDPGMILMTFAGGSGCHVSTSDLVKSVTGARSIYQEDEERWMAQVATVTEPLENALPPTQQTEFQKGVYMYGSRLNLP